MGKLPSGLSGMGLIRAHRGMAAALAAHLGVSRAAVSRWSMIPAEKVQTVADYTGWPRSRLRPDLWPPRGPKPKAKRLKAALPASGRKAKRTNGHAK